MTKVQGKSQNAAMQNALQVAAMACRPTLI
jgi:hypothetical protein